VPANFAAVALQGERQVERAKYVKEKQALEKLEAKSQILGLFPLELLPMQYFVYLDIGCFHQIY